MNISHPFSDDKHTRDVFDKAVEPREPFRQQAIVIAQHWLAVAMLALIVFVSQPVDAVAFTPSMQQDDPVQDSIDRDYSDELPRIDPLSPDEALDAFDVADGFRIELVASEPLVTDPVAMTFDEDGRLFVVEMRDYSEHPDEPMGRIRLLEDLDDDGVFETSHVFADELSWPTAIIASRGGVFVGAAPDILFLRDHDGDRVADERRVVYTGFGRTNVQGLLNSFRWGLDCRIHGATSSSGASLVHVDRSDEAPLVLRGRDFAFDPLSETVHAVTGGGQHGMSFNRWGEKFVCANSNHIQFIVYDDRYLSRNPYVTAMPGRLDIATDGPQADVFRTSPVEPWRTVRTRLRRQGIVPGPVERGGLAAGYFTGATGVTIFRGDAWPADFEGWAIIGDVGSNLIHRKQLHREGILYRAERVDRASEFVTSTDNWFRPVQFANGPDGALYVLDMYREVIEHPASLPPVIKQHLNLDSGRERGRIYRIVGEQHERPPSFALSELASADIVPLLGSSNGWTRETASRLIFERQDKSAIGALLRQLVDQTDATTTLWTLASLNSLDAISADVVLSGLNHPNEFVRRFALELAEPLLNEHGELVDRVLELTQDDSPIVRFQAALSLGFIDGPRRDLALAQCAIRDVDNPYIAMAIQSSLFQGPGEVLVHLLNDDVYAGTENGKQLIVQLCSQIGRQRNPDDVGLVMEWIGDRSGDDAQGSNDSQTEVSRLVIATLLEHGDQSIRDNMAIVTQGRASEMLSVRAVEALSIVADRDRDASERIAAVSDLRWAEPKQVIELVVDLLGAEQPADLQRAAIRILARIESDEIPDALISAWPTMTPVLRRQTTELLLSREAWIKSVLIALNSGTIARSEIDMGTVRGIAKGDNVELAQLASEVLEQSPLSSRESVITHYRQVLELDGDSERGAAVFEKQCATCHQVAGLGAAVGPNLEAMVSRGKEALLINMLDPNREVNPAYLTYTITTNTGRVFSGMIVEESSNSVTIQSANGEQAIVLRLDIESIISSGLSLMPEGLEEEIDIQSMADLLHFLQMSD